MRVLVATDRTQGQRYNDFCFATPGELVHLSYECEKNPDGNCGCARSLGGFDSDKGTTTVEVAERPLLTFEHYLQLLTDSYRRAGWNFPTEELADEATTLYVTATTHPVGAVLEYRAGEFKRRS